VPLVRLPQDASVANAGSAPAPPAADYSAPPAGGAPPPAWADSSQSLTPAPAPAAAPAANAGGWGAPAPTPAPAPAPAGGGGGGASWMEAQADSAATSHVQAQTGMPAPLAGMAVQAGKAHYGVGAANQNPTSDPNMHPNNCGKLPKLIMVMRALNVVAVTLASLAAVTMLMTGGA